MPQLKKQRTLQAEEEMESSKANVAQNVKNIKEVQQKNQENTLSSPLNLKSSLADLQNDSVKTVFFNNFEANLSEAFLKRYLAGKLLNCCSEHMQSQLLQCIKDTILIEKSYTTKPLPKVHVQSVEIIKPPDKSQNVYKVSN